MSTEFGFDQFVKSVEPRLREIFDTHQIPEEDREDLLQQALLALLYQWERCRDPERWVYGTIRRHCKMYWRTRPDVP